MTVPSDHPGGGSPKAEIFIHIDFATLTGLSGNPAELAGHGPLPTSIARAIAFDPNSTWWRIITDPQTGAPVDVGRTRYRPPAVTADHVKIRDRECRFPTCHRPAHDTDLDHVVPYQRNGETNTANLIGLCRRHHRTKHTPGWHFDLTEAGSLHITTPTGHTYWAA
ncbi:HNH endonuclease [Prauserella oleivorans]|uniref:HNH endonuclease n=1 Tax=Prauserella oleivorans TaxID=1478153 RepID=A0ABW5WFP2_9PSEU